MIGWADLQIVKFFPGERKPVLMSDDCFLRLSTEVTKLYPPGDIVEPSSSTSAAAPITEPPIGWQTRTNCPNRPISEFQILGEDGETIVLEMAKQQQGETATSAVVQQAQPQQQEGEGAATALVSVQKKTRPGGGAATTTVAVPPPQTQPQSQGEIATAAVVQQHTQPQQQDEEAATAPVLVVQQTQPQQQGDAPTTVVIQQTQQQQEEGVVATAPVIFETQQNQQHHYNDDGHVLSVDQAIYGDMKKWPCPKGYTPLDIYQGVHPKQRRVPQPHTFYPLCKVYESTNVFELAKVIWQIDSCHIYEELMSLDYIQSLTQKVPKLMWLRDTGDDDIPPLPVAQAFLSPKSIFIFQ